MPGLGMVGRQSQDVAQGLFRALCRTAWQHSLGSWVTGLRVFFADGKVASPREA
jgi:hypothetical protein